MVNPPIESEAKGSLPLNGSSAFVDPANGSMAFVLPANGSSLFVDFDANGSLLAAGNLDAKGSSPVTRLLAAKGSMSVVEPFGAKGSFLLSDELELKGSPDFDANRSPPTNGSFAAVDPPNGSVDPGDDEEKGSLELFADPPPKGSSEFVVVAPVPKGSLLKGSPPNGLAWKASLLKGSPPSDLKGSAVETKTTNINKLRKDLLDNMKKNPLLNMNNPVCQLVVIHLSLLKTGRAHKPVN